MNTQPPQPSLSKWNRFWRALGSWLRKVVLLLPVGLIKLYQYCISPYIHKSCRFNPSCSEYAIEAFKKHGLVKGFYLTVRRIVRCNPWGGSGYDPVPEQMKWFEKKERPLPNDPTCHNCGVQTVGRYCHQCGQNVFAGTGQPILHLLGQMLENAFSLDAKAPRTLALVMFRPGFLSSEFRAGKINRYVHPVKLFWMSTLIFFGLLISQIDKKDISDKNFITVSSSEGEPKDSNKEAEQLIALFSKYAPYVSFGLIPIFALMLALFFWRKRHFYMHHLTFTVHFHTFIWIYCGLLLIFQIVAPDWEFPKWLTSLLFFIPGVYFAVALHRYYQTKTRWQAIWKAMVISFIYFVIIIVVIIFLLLIAEQFFLSK